MEKVNKIDKSPIGLIRAKEREHKLPLSGMREVVPPQILQIGKGYKGLWQKKKTMAINSTTWINGRILWKKVPKSTQKEIDNFNSPRSILKIGFVV